MFKKNNKVIIVTYVIDIETSNKIFPVSSSSPVPHAYLIKILIKRGKWVHHGALCAAAVVSVMSSLSVKVAQCTVAASCQQWERRTSARTKTHRQRAPPRNYYNVHVVVLEIGCWWRASAARWLCNRLREHARELHMLHLAAARRRVCLHFDYTGSGCEEGGGRKCAGSVLIAFMYVHSHSHTRREPGMRNICISIGKFHEWGIRSCRECSFAWCDRLWWNSAGEVHHQQRACFRFHSVKL